MAVRFFGQGIGMYGNEQIRFGVIGNFSTPVQGDEYVPVPRIDNFYIGAVLLDLFAKFECDIQIDILFLGNFFPLHPGRVRRVRGL